MKELFRKYKGVVVFLLLFSGTYLVLSLVYAGYLNWSDNGNLEADFVTNLVAQQSTVVLESFGYLAHIEPNPSQPSMQLFVEGRFLARIVEGCNAISVIILFIAFVVAFSETFKKTVLFILAGTALIYAVNILRIAILSISLYHYPKYEHVLHGVVFPGLLYGMVFLLWFVWVRSLTPTTAT
ncbi:MAG: exosortase family protein XrtF [Marinirhabdus sp.]|nr:exosortase family protein XrtF [Marinirhabdus sp.]